MTRKKMIRSAIRISAAALMVSLAPFKGHAQSKSSCPANEITRSLHKIASEKANSRRAEIASALALRLKELGPECVTDEDVTILISLLRDDDDSLRFFAAAMIGNSGPRAKRAIPALEKALADRPCENMSLTSAAAIRAALDKLRLR